MQNVFELSAKVTQYDTTVLIMGESGTGKELIAQAIHYAGLRRTKPLVPVNCGGIPETLLESELFGHIKGAFTGADRNKKGLFDEADGETVFLDEIGEMPQPLQVKLLRVLQGVKSGRWVSRTTGPSGCARDSRHFAQIEGNGGGRNFSRGSLFTVEQKVLIDLPPLRDHNEDIPLLSQHFISHFNTVLGRKVKGIAPAAMSQLLSCQWPGNVRELENAIERAMVLTEGDWLDSEHFPRAGGASGRHPARADVRRLLAQKCTKDPGEGDDRQSPDIYPGRPHTGRSAFGDQSSLIVEQDEAIRNRFVTRNSD